MKALLPLALVVVIGAACDHYVPRVVCHNSNCKEPTDPSQDDKIESLTESLALVNEDDVPLIDGMEIDIFWDGAGERCIFAHDLDDASESAPADAPVQVLNEHLLSRARAGLPVTSDGGPFVVFIEMKGHVGETIAEKHNDEQLAQHASCAMDVVLGLVDGAARSGVALDITLTSFAPEVLRAARAEPRWDERPGPRVTLGLGMVKFAPPPLNGQSQPIVAFGDLPLTAATVHPHWLRRGELRAIRQRGLALSYWMFQLVPETMAAIEQDRPEYVTTSEATLMRRWLER